MSEYPPRFVALVDAYPTEAEARDALNTELAVGMELGAYLGIWRMPTPEAPAVHLFTDASEDWLVCSGWKRVHTREDDRTAPLPDRPRTSPMPADPTALPTDRTLCPAATGVPTDSIRCTTTGAEHRCRADALPRHFIHTCHCGTQWTSSTSEARKLIEQQPRVGGDRS